MLRNLGGEKGVVGGQGGGGSAAWNFHFHFLFFEVKVKSSLWLFHFHFFSIKHTPHTVSTFDSIYQIKSKKLHKSTFSFQMTKMWSLHVGRVKSPFERQHHAWSLGLFGIMAKNMKWQQLTLGWRWFVWLRKVNCEIKKGLHTKRGGGLAERNMAF